MLPMRARKDMKIMIEVSIFDIVGVELVPM